WGLNPMRILKIMLLSTALAAFGAATAVAQPVQFAAKTDDTTTATPKKTKKVAAKKSVKKKTVKGKKPATKKVAAKPKTSPSTDTETAPGNPPPGNSPN
ncbi:MAG: hypothetical protein ACREIP_19645, partial [Alphaproteobacteria bacterium]